MQIVTIHQAKTQLSKLIQAAARGEDVVIARGRIPLVRLVQFKADTTKRKLGFAKAKVRMAPDFDAPLDDFADYAP